MTDLWHQLRSENIGGSDIAALFGESPYSTRYKLWHEKKGNLLPPDLDADERVQAGKFMEAGALAWANAKWGTEFFQPFVYVKHPRVVGMGCTPDAFDLANSDRMAQVKIVDGLQFFKDWDAEGNQIIQAPLHILLQVQHEMLCCERSVSWLIVLVGGNRLFHMICEADAIIAATLVGGVQAFWQSQRDGVEPAPDFARDGVAIEQFRKRLPVIDVLDLNGNGYFRERAKECLAATVQRNRLNDELDALHAEIGHLAGNAQLVRCDDMLLKFYPHRKNPKITTEGAVL